MFSLTFLIIIILRKRAERAAKRKSRLDGFQIKMVISFENIYFALKTSTTHYSRWDTGSNNKGEKHVAPGMSTIVNVERMGDEKAQEIYLLNLQIREITAKMGTPTLGIPLNPRDRSPSPEPIYNSKGVRVNTRSEIFVDRQQFLTIFSELSVRG